ncbi:MAG: hypothetical protein LUJ09_01840 [Firmicutes bacterium]|nr:hypothetical protein [Bacillota bacterium]
MKRFAVLLLAILMLTSVLFACSGETEDTTPSTTNPTEASTAPTETDPEPTETEPEIEVITIAEALELCGEEGNVTEDRYYIRGTVDSIDNANYGAMTISDETGTISVYGTYSSDGSINYSDMDERPYKGDEVLLYCILQNYGGTKEVKNAWLIEFTVNEVQIDTSLYQDMSVAEVRAAETGTMVLVDGVVAQITYAYGMVPSGFILVDDTSSIYVYDGDAAARVKVGNTVTVAASKTYWILESESSYAETYGYTGCNQLESAVLVSNDGATDTAFDTSWIQETTIKDILDTPVSSDITTLIYKVNAVVHKVDGSGFVNYYFNDLDDSTGSYTYTQCSGSDFAWLDEYDGKICTVYLMALNAKSSSSGCVYRFLPVQIVDDEYTIDTDYAAEFAVKYYGVTQLQSSYTGDPELELITSVSSALLGVENIKLSYKSSDTSVLTFTTSGSKVIMNCLASGKATVTVTGSYGGKEYSQKVSISVTVAKKEVSYPTVADAIAASVGETVTVKGVVGPSLVNRVGFYLIDDTGVIAIVTDSDTMSTLQIGQEVVIEGKRDRFYEAQSFEHYGQTALTGCTVVTNFYGNQAYSTASFDGEISAADFNNLDVTKDYSTSVFTMTATVYVVETYYYTNIYLVDGETQVALYCSSASQYSWLQAYAGLEVTVEIAPCNWNNKNAYKGCVLAVITDSGKILNELNFG